MIALTFMMGSVEIRSYFTPTNFRIRVAIPALHPKARAVPVLYPKNIDFPVTNCAKLATKNCNLGQLDHTQQPILSAGQATDQQVSLFWLHRKIWPNGCQKCSYRRF